MAVMPRCTNLSQTSDIQHFVGKPLNELCRVSCAQSGLVIGERIQIATCPDYVNAYFELFVIHRHILLIIARGVGFRYLTTGRYTVTSKY